MMQSILKNTSKGIRKPHLIEQWTVKTLHLADEKPYEPTGD